MSSGKRSATSELNHDNWDDEVESEEAGTFSQADENTLKGRVIKKAKRRGLANQDGAPSVFAGFGGFKAAPSGGSSFSFLSKPANGSENGGSTTTTGQGFVFGNQSNNSSATTVPASFSFGSKSTATNGSDKDDSKTTTDTNGTNGLASSNIFQFGSQSKSTTSSIFGGTSTQNSFANASDSKEGTFGSADITGKKNEVVESKNDSFKSEPSGASSNLPPLNQLPAFKPSGGSKWSCSVCMVANDADKEKCVCCEEPKPGLAVKKDTKTTSNLLGTIAPGGGFKFGVSSTEPSSTGQSNSGFNFGTSSTISNSSQGFKFGVNSTTTNTAGFSSSSSSELNTKKPAISTETTISVDTVKKTVKSSTEPFERVTDEEVKRIASNSKEFLSHLSALNKQFFDWIDLHIKKNPYILISPCIRDYEKHLAELAKEYANKADETKEKIESPPKIDRNDEKPPMSSEKPPQAKGLLSGIFGNSTSTASNASTSNFSFGSSQPFSFSQEKKSSDSPSEKESTTATTSGFSFGSSLAGGASSGFSFGGTAGSGSSFGSSSMFGQAAAAAIQATKDEGADADDDNEEPPKEEIKQVVEDDAIHSVRCKLFYMKNKEFKEKGLGMLYLKKVADSEDKTQLVLRAETNLGNILLNIMLTKQMNLEKRKNCVQFVCIPNPEIPGIEAGNPTTMLVKVKNVDQASILEDEMKKRIDII